MALAIESLLKAADQYVAAKVVIRQTIERKGPAKPRTNVRRQRIRKGASRD